MDAFYAWVLENLPVEHGDSEIPKENESENMEDQSNRQTDQMTGESESRTVH